MAGLAMGISIDIVPTFDSNLNKNRATTYFNSGLLLLLGTVVDPSTLCRY